jgi:hypothetical protein
MTEKTLYGLMIEFTDPDSLVSAARRLKAAGYRHLDAYTPFPVEGLGEELGTKSQPVALITLLGGIAGGVTGYFMQWYSAVVDYPINVGGRPFHSAPSFIPITFELTILFAAIAAVFGQLLLNGLPRPYHPVFNVPRFLRASQDRFFLCVEAQDPQFDRERTRQLLAEIAGGEVLDVDK